MIDCFPYIDSIWQKGGRVGGCTWNNIVVVNYFVNSPICSHKRQGNKMSVGNNLSETGHFQLGYLKKIPNTCIWLFCPIVQGSG